MQNERYASQGKNATLYLSDLNSCWVQYIFCQLFLVYNLVQDRDSKKFSDSKEEYKTFLFLMYFLISSECLFYGRQLKALKLFEAKVCISFQQVALVYKCERLKKNFCGLISILFFKTLSNKIILKQYNLHCKTIIWSATPASGMDKIFGKWINE